MPPLPRILLPALLALAAVAVDSVVAIEGAHAQQIWRGRSGGFDVEWSARDVAARRVRDGARVLSLRAAADSQWTPDPEADPADQPSFVSVGYRVLSVVGSVVSVEERWYCDCGGAHPISSTRFAAYDLSRGTLRKPAPVSATALVPEPELLRALLADAVVRQALRSAGVTGQPRTLSALLDAVEHEAVRVGDDECTYSLGEEFLSSFAVHHVEGGRMALRFSLSHHVEICRGRMTQIGVLVPTPERLRADVAAADARRAGFLMKDTRRIAPGDQSPTRFEYAAKRP